MKVLGVSIENREGESEGGTSREINPTGSYLSTSDVRLYLGLGTEKTLAHLEIEWPSGKKQALTGISAGQTLTLDESNAR